MKGPWAFQKFSEIHCVSRLDMSGLESLAQITVAHPLGLQAAQNL